ncbi:MAG: polyphosphate:AMP phosphotransferase [Gammaproteobacteria bacterium]
MTDYKAKTIKPGSGTAKISKAQFKAAIPDLRVRLINTQYRLKDADFSVIILLAGPDRIGCEQVVDRLHEWMDGRYLDTWFADKPSDEEASRPRFWRLWRNMPAKGRTGLMVGATFTDIIGERLRGKSRDGKLRRLTEHFTALDRLLLDDGTIVLKFWLDIPAKAMKKRLEEFKENQAPYVEDLDYVILKHYKAAQPIISELLDQTGAHLPWLVVDGRDERARDLHIAEKVLENIEQQLDQPGTTEYSRRSTKPAPAHLDTIDLDASLPYPAYRKSIETLQSRLHELSLDMRQQGLGVVLAFEGWDAAGKGGAIRRITHAMSARDCKVMPVAAPTDEELAHHYLWRFWRHLPRDGQMRIFDRSWYGRVLVERVEELAQESEWRRAYSEINDFENQIVEHGHLVLKFWLHIDPDEQLKRFKAREKTPYKKYKITADDYRNREQWPAYLEALNEMVEHTSTPEAPWHLIAANDKRWARVKVLDVLCNALETALSQDKKKKSE